MQEEAIRAINLPKNLSLQDHLHSPAETLIVDEYLTSMTSISSPNTQAKADDPDLPVMQDLQALYSATEDTVSDSQVIYPIINQQ